MSRLSRILPVFYFIVDVTTLVMAFVASLYLLTYNYYQGLEWITLAPSLLLWTIIGFSRRLYQSNLNNGFTARMISYSKSYLIFVVALLSTTFLALNVPAVGKVVLSFVLIFLALNLTANTILINLICAWRRREHNIKQTLIIGGGDLALKVTAYFAANPDFGFRVKGYLKPATEECKVDPKKVQGTLKDIERYLRENTIDEIVIALPYKAPSKRIRNIVDQADLYGIRVSYLPDYQGLFGKYFKIIHDGELEAVNVRQLALDEFYPVIEKAIFDYVFSAMVLLCLSPVFIAIAVLIKLDSPGPVFYCPMRIGRGGRPFRVFKFRTMYENDAVAGGKRSTEQNDPRITSVGRVLRKYSLDELPQFFNVILGDMSVVGPRPHRHFLNQQMREHLSKYMLRHYFKPGITGWAQVNGWRGPTETELQIRQRTAHDLWYIENWSFLLDLKIIWQTIFSRKVYENAF